jgi:hypothetical protein
MNRQSATELGLYQEVAVFFLSLPQPKLFYFWFDFWGGSLATI